MHPTSPCHVCVCCEAGVLGIPVSVPQEALLKCLLCLLHASNCRIRAGPWNPLTTRCASGGGRERREERKGRGQEGERKGRSEGEKEGRSGGKGDREGEKKGMEGG